MRVTTMNTPETSHLTLLATQSCPKLLITAEGKLTFNVWLDPHDHSLYLALTHNEGGGYFSNELILVTHIIDSLRPLKAANKAFPAVRLRGIFEGKSANNASFLGAVLRHLQVLIPCPKNNKLHLVCDDLETWPTRLSQLFAAQSSDSSVGVTDSTNQIKTPKSRGKNANKSPVDNDKPNTTASIMENDDENHS